MRKVNALSSLLPFTKNHVLTWIPAKPKSIVTVIDFIFHQSDPLKQVMGGTKGGLSWFWANQDAVRLPPCRPALWKGAKTWQKRMRSLKHLGRREGVT